MAGPGDGARSAWSIHVRGTVQGVGFRPFVYRVAAGLGLDGSVRNVGRDVLIEAAGASTALYALAEALSPAASSAAIVGPPMVTPAPFSRSCVTGFAVLASEGLESGRLSGL